jgi:hypothetical protein
MFTDEDEWTAASKAIQHLLACRYGLAVGDDVGMDLVRAAVTAARDAGDITSVPGVHVEQVSWYARPPIDGLDNWVGSDDRAFSPDAVDSRIGTALHEAVEAWHNDSSK